MFSPATGDRRRVGALLTGFFTVMLVDGAFGFNLRAPVSGTMFALTAGAIDGSISRRTSPNRGQPHVSGVLQRITIALGILALAAFTGTMGIRTFASQVRLQQGLGAIYWKDYDGAIRVLNAAHRWAPWNWLPPFHAGNAWSAQGQHENAIANYEYALERHPNYIPAHIALAKEYFNAAAGKPGADSEEFLSRCRRHLDAATRLCPVLPEAEDVAGRVDLAHATGVWRAEGEGQGRIEAARAARSHFTNALAYGAENRSELYRFLAQSATILDEGDAARNYFDRALQAFPVDAMALAEFYRWAAANGQLDAFQKSVKLHVDALAAKDLSPPDEVEAVIRVWEDGASAVPEAVDILADAIRRSDTEAAHRFTWAGLVVHVATDKFEVDNSDAAQTLVDLAAILDYTGEYAAAEQCLVRAESALDEENRVRCEIFRASIILKLGRCDEALDLMRPIALRNPRDLDVRLAFAEQLARCGRRNEAVFEYQTILRDFRLEVAARERIQQAVESLREP
jgi:tetratricopeptide (TPR) repeat protein